MSDSSFLGGMAFALVMFHQADHFWKERRSVLDAGLCVVCGLGVAAMSLGMAFGGQQ